MNCKEMKTQFNGNTGVVNNSNNSDLFTHLNDNISMYYEKYYKGKRIMSVNNYLSKTKPLSKIRLSSFIIPMIILTIIFGPGGAILGFMLGVPVYVFRCSNQNRKEAISTARNGHIADVKDLYLFMINNMNISDIEVTEYTANSINFIFRNSTKHRLIIDIDNYYLECRGATKRQFVKSGFTHSASVMFRNSVYLNPIVLAFVECYLENKGV